MCCSALARAVPVSACAVAVAVLCTLSAAQIDRWRGDHIMWPYSIQVDPTDWRILDTYAEVLAKEGRMDEARVYYKRTLAVSPPASMGVKPMLQLGKTYVFIGDADAACKLYLGSIEHYPDNPLAQNNAAICHLRNKNIEAALRHFRAGAALDIVNSMYDKLAVKNNFAEFQSWLSRGGFKGAGDYHGKLLW